MVAYTRPQQRKKEESERLRGERERSERREGIFCQERRKAPFKGASILKITSDIILHFVFF